MPVPTMPLPTMALLTMPLPTMALLTMPQPTMALLTMSTLGCPPSSKPPTLTLALSLPLTLSPQVLTHHAHMLPSFEAMRAADQHTIRFTQSKMSFNHGWLVQAP